MNIRRMRRRPGGRRRGYSRSSHAVKGNISTAVIIICVSIAAGYFTATYLVGPLLGLDMAPLVFNDQKTETQEKDAKENDDKIVEDVSEADEKAAEESGYVLQYGSFSSKDAAEVCINNLKQLGIEARILEKDGAYKVISQLFESESAARAKLEKQKDAVDVFITHIP